MLLLTFDQHLVFIINCKEKDMEYVPRNLKLKSFRFQQFSQVSIYDYVLQNGAKCLRHCIHSYHYHFHLDDITLLKGIALSFCSSYPLVIW